MLLASSILFFIIVFGIAIFFAITVKFGVKVDNSDNDRKELIYESGITDVIEMKATHNLKYYIVVIFFILFDIEVVFMYPWAVNLASFGIAGFYKMLVFMLILIAGLVYIYSKKVFTWH